jgi:hypothetical protein
MELLRYSLDPEEPMLRKFYPFTSVLALLIVIALGSVAFAQMSTTGLSGNWSVTSTGDQFQQGTVHLSQQGPTIVGRFTRSGGPPIDVSGKLNNNVLSGTFQVSGGGESGWITIFFSENGRGFRGEWGYHGRPPNGLITGRR